MFALPLAILLLAGAAQSPETCAMDRAAALALPFEQFDQDPARGWRPLANRPGCEAAAADLIAAYREVHWGSLEISRLHLNYWHEGQLRAMAGQREQAIRLMMAGVYPGNGLDFEDYALGTIAFLNHDLDGLKSARTRLATLPPTPEFEQMKARTKAMSGVELAWPLNLDVLDRLIACFDELYRDAYGCRTKVGVAR